MEEEGRGRGSGHEGYEERLQGNDLVAERYGRIEDNQLGLTGGKRWIKEQLLRRRKTKTSGAKKRNGENKEDKEEGNKHWG